MYDRGGCIGTVDRICEGQAAGFVCAPVTGVQRVLYTASGVTARLVSSVTLASTVLAMSVQVSCSRGDDDCHVTCFGSAECASIPHCASDLECDSPAVSRCTQCEQDYFLETPSICTRECFGPTPSP